MAEIKDKVVTVESLSTLHEYNKQTYMSMVNPQGSGSFSMNKEVDADVGDKSTTLGSNNTASGYASYADGVNTVSKGNVTHSEGYGTVAASDYQHVQGQYNIEDSENKYAHIVGNGEFTERSNAHTIDWDGNAWFAGGVYVGGTSQYDATKLVKSTNVISIEYGDTLPNAGTVGRIFFKKISE